jgi:hypothetical protein
LTLVDVHALVFIEYERSFSMKWQMQYEASCLIPHLRIKSALHSLRVAVKVGDCPSEMKGGEWAQQLTKKIRDDMEILGMPAERFGTSEQELDEAHLKAAIAWYKSHFAYIRAMDSNKKLFEKDRLKCNLVYCLRQEGISVWDVAGEYIEQILGWSSVRYEDYPKWVYS